MLKALLIDLDGTLVDCAPALFQLFQKFLKQYGHQASRQEFDALLGLSIDEIVLHLKEKYALKDSVHDLSLMYVSLLMLQGFEGTELFQGAKEVIEEAKKAKLKLGIVSSGNRSLINICLTPLKLNSAFDVIVTSEDMPKAKPNPEMYLIALDKMGIKPEAAAALEDSEEGVKAAQKAGLQVIMITHGKPPKVTDKNVTYLANWHEIGAWLRSK